VLTLKELEQKAQGGKTGAKIAGSVAGKQIRKSARGNRFAFAQLTDPTGAYEVTIFSDTLEKHGEHLEVGKNVVLAVEATMEADQLKLLARTIQPADISVADAASMGLKIYLSDEDAINSIATRLNDKPTGAAPMGKGPVHLV